MRSFHHANAIMTVAANFHGVTVYAVRMTLCMRDSASRRVPVQTVVVAQLLLGELPTLPGLTCKLSKCRKTRLDYNLISMQGFGCTPAAKRHQGWRLERDLALDSAA
jgi:hypothetical protein